MTVNLAQLKIGDQIVERATNQIWTVTHVEPGKVYFNNKGTYFQTHGRDDWADLATPELIEKAQAENEAKMLLTQIDKLVDDSRKMATIPLADIREAHRLLGG